jgi:hypothetical protein
LPAGASWQKLKDLVHFKSGEEIQVGHVEVDRKSSTGVVRLPDENNFNKALGQF